jgi:phage repressor protein C with HTH and peptisase S24 domain
MLQSPVSLSDWMQDRPHLRIVPVRSDSMSPTFNLGDAVLCDVTDTRIVDHVYVMSFGDGPQIARLQLFANGRIRIIRDNPRYGPPEEIDRAEIDQYVLGRVILHLRRT